jgi:hypothetical protein
LLRAAPVHADIDFPDDVNDAWLGVLREALADAPPDPGDADEMAPHCGARPGRRDAAAQAAASTPQVR